MDQIFVFGRYPAAEGIWEGGHMTVTLDPKERFCGCGGTGHLEEIMGHRSMRLRFIIRNGQASSKRFRRSDEIAVIGAAVNARQLRAA